MLIYGLLNSFYGHVVVHSRLTGLTDAVDTGYNLRALRIGEQWVCQEHVRCLIQRQTLASLLDIEQ
jgi:hypothetical protein